MRVSVCPIAVIVAPLERVWELLANPSSYDSWWDAHTDVIVPEGPDQAGQTVYAHTYALGRRWNVTTVVEHLDAAPPHPALHRMWVRMPSCRRSGRSVARW